MTQIHRRSEGAVGKRLVIFGASNIASDLFECAALAGVLPGKVVLHLPEPADARSIPLAVRVERLAPLGAVPSIQPLASFIPAEDEVYILGPSTPARVLLANEVRARFNVPFTTLIHPAASVSRLAVVSPGCFVGAGSVLAPGVHLEEHVFVNRCVSIGHDTRVGCFSRIQPGAHVASLTRIGRGVSIGAGASVLERLVIGDNSVIGAGSVVLNDLDKDVAAWGSPAKVQRRVDGPAFRDEE